MTMTTANSRFSLRLLSLVLVLVIAVGELFFTGCSQLQRLGAPPTSASLAEQTYQEVWQTIAESYVDPTFNGLDWSGWKEHYVNRLRDADDAAVAIDTMLAGLNDPYTRYLPPRQMQEQTMQIDAKLQGIGVQIAMKDGKIRVVAPLEGTPAEKAGLKPLDTITHINGEQTAGMTIEQAADKIRGQAGTAVRLTLLRVKNNRPSNMTVSIPRAEIQIKSVYAHPLTDLHAPEIGYIRLNSFISEDAMAEMKTAAQKLSTSRAIILDLRGNFGGLLSNAVEISDMFLDSGRIVSMVDRQHQEKVFQARPGEDFMGKNALTGKPSPKPVVVLIDGASASASEILSGALKDNHRAVLIGSTTFGKGLVQKIHGLQNGGGLNLTIAKYYTPNGTDINKKGIAPNVNVPFTEADLRAHRDVQLLAAVRLLEKQLGGKK